MYVIENEFARVSFNQLGLIGSIYSKITGTEIISTPGQADNWKLLIRSEGYESDTICGKDQKPTRVDYEPQRIVIHYDFLDCYQKPINVSLDFVAQLVGEEIRFSISLQNNSGRRIREVWAPVIRGFGGFSSTNEKHPVNLAKADMLAYDLIESGLPRRKDPFRVDGEVCQFHYFPELMMWWDFFCEDQGVYFSSDDRVQNLTALRLERHPHGITSPADHHWLDISIGKLTTIDDGESWTMAESVIWPHRDDWHAAADHYRTWALSWMKFPQLPEQIRYYTGWQNLVGKTYLNEVYHTFDQITDIMIEGKQKMEIAAVQLYGHSEVGCEGANYYLKPGSNLGGPDGFKRMCDRLHEHGIKVIVFTHRHSAVAYDRKEEFQPYERWVFRDRLGNVRKEAWWKTTMESLTTYIEGQNGLRYYEATAPIWARVCPSCDLWWETFLDEIKKLIDLGCDGIQMDTNGIEGGVCYASDHGHKPGEWMMPRVQERMEWLERNVHAYKKDFLLCAETVNDFYFQYCVLPYTRLRFDNGLEVFKYTFPELKQQVAVAAYSYDQVAKGFLFGYGFNCEVEGLKKTILAYPEFAEYIGQVNQIRMRYRDYLLDGRYLDTRGARVKGQVRYGVYRGPRGLAIVLWNNRDRGQECEVGFTEEGLDCGVLCIPGQQETTINLPGTVMIEPHRAVAIIAERSLS